jgi:hypothetical protein
MLELQDIHGNRLRLTDERDLVVVPHEALPRLSVVPEVSSAAQSVQRFGDGTNDVFYLRGTVNAGDAVVAGARLKSGGPDVFFVNPGDVRRVLADVAITRLDLVCIGDVTSGSLSAGEIVDVADTASDFRTAMVTFVFDEGDDVRALTVEASERLSAGTAGAPAATANYVDALIRGGTDA